MADQDLIRYMIDRIEKVDQKIDGLANKVDKLFAFKWQIIGGAGLLTFILTCLLQVYFR